MNLIQPKPFYKHLYFYVLLAVAAGVGFGSMFPAQAIEAKVVGDWFIQAVKMLIAPMIFTTIVIGIAGSKSLKSAGKAGGLALVYFEVVSTIALGLGVLMINLIKPGVGMNIDIKTLDTKNVSAFVGKAKNMDMFHMIIDTFQNTLMLQVLVGSIIFGLILQKINNQSTFNLIKKANDILFKIIGWLMYAAPAAAFGAMSFTVGKYGVKALLPLLSLIGTFYATGALFVFVILGGIAYLAGFNIFKFLNYIKTEILLVLGTSSSETALPTLMQKLENAGVEKSVVGVVVPTGYSFNLDGTSIYMSMAAIFIAQALGIDMSLGQQLSLLAILMITSKTATPVTGSGFIVLAASLGATGVIPVAGIALIFGIDRFMSEARSIINLIGNAVATVAIAKIGGNLNLEQLKETLDNH